MQPLQFRGRCRVLCPRTSLFRRRVLPLDLRCCEVGTGDQDASGNGKRYHLFDTFMSNANPDAVALGVADVPMV